MKNKRMRYPLAGLLAAGCAIGVALPTRVAAQVSQSDFDSLKKMVQELNDRVQKLDQVHQQDQQAHERDVQQLQQLRQQLGDTQKTALDAQQKAETASQVQPIHPIPPGEGNATHNFMVVGDAEVQWGKVDG